MKKIDILGSEYKVIVVTDYKKWSKITGSFFLEPNTVAGLCVFSEQSIYIFANVKEYLTEVSNINNMIKAAHRHCVKTFWHEVGHAVEYETPSSLEPTEYVSSMFESMPKLIVQIAPIEKYIKEALTEASKKRKR